MCKNSFPILYNNYINNLINKSYKFMYYSVDDDDNTKTKLWSHKKKTTKSLL